MSVTPEDEAPDEAVQISVTPVEARDEAVQISGSPIERSHGQFEFERTHARNFF